MSESNIQAEWVKGIYSGEQGKYVRGLANEGIGYKLLEEINSSTVAVAFRRPINKVRPEHLHLIVSPFEVKKLEDWRNKV